MTKISEIEWRANNIEELKNNFLKLKEEDFKSFVEREYRDYIRLSNYQG